jgi:acyl carrier protein
MTPDSLRQTVLDAVRAIAPEADFTHLRSGDSLREQLDIDSFDFLNVLIQLHARLGVDIPEADYGKVATLDAMLAYLGQRVA